MYREPYKTTVPCVIPFKVTTIIIIIITLYYTVIISLSIRRKGRGQCSNAYININIYIIYISTKTTRSKIAKTVVVAAATARTTMPSCRCRHCCCSGLFEIYHRVVTPTSDPIRFLPLHTHNCCCNVCVARRQGQRTLPVGGLCSHPIRLEKEKKRNHFVLLLLLFWWSCTVLLAD